MQGHYYVAAFVHINLPEKNFPINMRNSAFNIVIMVVQGGVFLAFQIIFEQNCENAQC